MTLTYHGRSKDVCQSVITKYKDNPKYKNNKTVQEWVRQSELVLKE
jgi:hypothetical protein